MPRDAIGLVIAFVLIAAAVAVGWTLGNMLTARLGMR